MQKAAHRLYIKNGIKPMMNVSSVSYRIVIDFLDSKFFCKNSHHMKGEALMRKRHLEILGYRVVQVEKVVSVVLNLWCDSY